MKKIVFLLAVVSALFQPLAAQDTIHTHDMRTISRYFVPVWPDAFPSVTIQGEKYERGYLIALGENFNKFKEMAWQLYTDDTLQVYGIAASLTTLWRFSPDYYELAPPSDTSCEFVYDYLRLYEADPDSLRHIGDELLVNLRYTPISYYIDLGLLRNNYSVDFHPVLPMYERYFSSPVTVADSFYVGRRYRTENRNSEMSVRLVELADTARRGTRMRADYLDYIYNDNVFGIHDSVIRGWNYVDELNFYHPLLFPIIAPPDTVADTTIYSNDTVVTGSVIVRPGNTVVITPGDTVIIGGDTIVNLGDTLTVIPGDTVVIGGDTLVINIGDTLTVNSGVIIVNPDGTIVISPGGTVVISSGGNSGVGIRGVNLLYRYTAVMPNPARHRATVTSSFGLERIDLYDAHGRLLKSFPASGLKADLDLSPFPPGTYLLRILTPAGQTTKKLILQ